MSATRPPVALVVDDEPLVLALARHALEADGFHVWSAGGAREALALYRLYGAQFDVLLLDAQLGESTAAALLAALRAEGAAQSALLMTASLGEEGPADASLLAKPFDLAALGRAVRATLGGRAGWGRPTRPGRPPASPP
jgi:CheY-like chemotaxis protein